MRSGAGLVAFLVFASEWLLLCHKEVVHLAILYASNQARQKIHFLAMGPSYLGGDGQLSEYPSCKRAVRAALGVSRLGTIFCQQGAGEVLR